MKFIPVFLAAAHLLSADDVPAPTPTPAAEQAKADPAWQTPSQVLNQHLPRWIRFGFDHRFRFEDYRALKYKQNNDDRWFLNRFRINMTLLPTSWWSFTFQAQDARIFFKDNAAGQNSYTNKTDLRQAFTEIGNAAKGKIALRIGRQELAYGEERVIGAANWGSIGRVFDAAKLIVRQGPVQLDLVSASVVIPELRGLSHHKQGNNLHLAYLSWKNPVPNATLDPYFIWRIGASDALQGIKHQDRRVAGFRFAGKLPESWDYSTEFNLQRGNVNNQFGHQNIRAFATHTVFRHTFSHVKYTPRIIGEYNYASGDKNAGGSTNGTYDQLYPTPHEKYGLADQVGWQNISHFATGVDIVPRNRFTLKMMFHDWNLAQAKDGVYVAGGGLLFRDVTGRSGKHVGDEVDLTGQYTFGPHYIGLGYGRLFPGQFLKAFSTGNQLNYIYLNVGYRF